MAFNWITFTGGDCRPVKASLTRTALAVINRLLLTISIDSDTPLNCLRSGHLVTVSPWVAMATIFDLGFTIHLVI